MDALQQLVSDRLDEIAQKTSHRPTVREAAEACGKKKSWFNHHFGPRRRRRQEITDEDLQAVSDGLGIPLRALQEAAIVAADYVIDVRRFDLSVIASVLPEQMSTDKRREHQAQARDLAAGRSRGLGGS